MEHATFIPPELPDESLVRVSEVARWFRVSARTLYNWSAAGRLPAPIPLGPKTTVFRVGELRAAVEQLQTAADAAEREGA